MYVEKADPRVWVDDVADGIQLKATSILVTGEANHLKRH